MMHKAEEKFDRIFYAIVSVFILFLFIGLAGSALGMAIAKVNESSSTSNIQKDVTVYTSSGEVLKRFGGVYNVRTTDGMVCFDSNSKRHTYYNCFVEVVEPLEEKEGVKTDEKHSNG